MGIMMSCGSAGRHKRTKTQIEAYEKAMSKLERPLEAGRNEVRLLEATERASTTRVVELGRLGRRSEALTELARCNDTKTRLAEARGRLRVIERDYAQYNRALQDAQLLSIQDEVGRAVTAGTSRARAEKDVSGIRAVQDGAHDVADVYSSAAAEAMSDGDADGDVNAQLLQEGDRTRSSALEEELDQMLSSAALATSMAAPAVIASPTPMRPRVSILPQARHADVAALLTTGRLPSATNPARKPLRKDRDTFELAGEETV